MFAIVKVMSKLWTFIHHLFIPRQENNYRAKALHTDFLTSYLVVALLLVFGFKIVGGGRNILGFATDITTEKLFLLTNSEREKNKLSPLTYNPLLAQAAQEKAQDMFAKNYWAHFGPSGETPWNFVLDAGYRYEYAGENLAKNFLFSQGVIDAWMQSVSHRENILRPEYKEVGFAVVNGMLNGEETTLVVQMFGTPLTAVRGTQTEEKNVMAQKIPKPIVTSGAPHEDVRLPSLALSFNLQLLFFSLLLIVLGLDLVFALRHNVIRVTGRNIAHIIFLGSIIVGLLILSKGAIV